MEIADYIIADDRVLVELVLQGDNIAFEYLFERYKEAIHRLFIQRTNNPLDADDLLQETFIKVYINIHRYNPAYTFGQWVYTIARNTFVDFIRRRQEDLPIDERYLQAMPPRYRQLIVMRFFEEYSYEEIAMKLELPLGTVKTQIHRAREQMCRLIAADEKS